MSIASTEYGSSEYGGSNQNQASSLGGSLSQNIKKEIVLNLNALVQAGVLNSVFEIDLGKDPITMEPTAGYPFAIVGMPSVTAEIEDTHTNKRNYKFNILIVASYESLADQNEGIEFIMDSVLNQFDNNFTLAGAAVATVMPVEITAAPVSTGDKTLVAFMCTIKAQTLFTWDNPAP
jgi:hypothetical protein